ncbi:MAG: thiamine pyrophosphate-dependent dehydrogenase E1 component subunit alpha [Chloroflexi bacterium]|nr:MAG: thiamine pyrophosphate-dependent dehydrogenase E1 component subunit alpha [Chloroflexota bacterium]
MLGRTAVTRGSLSVADEVGLYLELYRRMVLIRQFEDLVNALFLQGQVHGTTHLCSGQEAVAVGVTSVLDPADRVAGTYRGHGHALALGLDPQRLLDELLGRETGICAGRAGSMNVVDLEHGLMGCFGIVGGSIAAATGAGLALRGTGNVAVAFFGDGATNQGYFFECLNFAKVMNLPVVYVCENNGYGEYTPFTAVTAGSIIARPLAMEIPSQTLDGNDLWVVRAAARQAVETARRGDGPSFIEALTYRFVGHSRSDPGKYRPEGELDRWRLKDPLAVGRRRLVEEHRVPESEVESIVEDVRTELDRVRQKGLAAPFPKPDASAREFKDG